MQPRYKSRLNNGMKSLFKCNCFVVGSKVENALSSLLLIWLCVNSAWIVINFLSLFFIFRNGAAFDRVCFLDRLHSDISVASKTLFFLVSFFFSTPKHRKKDSNARRRELLCFSRHVLVQSWKSFCSLKHFWNER